LAVAQRSRQLLQYAPRVADDAHLDRAVAADLAGVAVDLHDLRGLPDAGAVAEAEIERRTRDQDHVGLRQRVLAGMEKEVRVVGRQTSAPGAVQVDRRAEP